MAEVQIAPLKTATPEDALAIARLVRQLSSHVPVPSKKDIDAILALPMTTMFLTRLEGEIVGITTLVVIQVATGIRASIEDVVVDADHRGKGIGEALMRAALAAARQQYARKADLTSNPSRRAAHRLYQRLGFRKRETDVFRLDFKDESGT